MCKNWREKGSCRYGDKCLFAHGDHELSRRQSTENSETKEAKNPGAPNDTVSSNKDSDTKSEVTNNIPSIFQKQSSNVTDDVHSSSEVIAF